MLIAFRLFGTSPDLGMDVFRRCQIKDYTYLVKWWECLFTIHGNEAKQLGFTIGQNPITWVCSKSRGTLQFEKYIVQQNAFGGIDSFLMTFTFVSIVGSSCLFYVRYLQSLMWTGTYGGIFFVTVTENRIAVVQRSKAGLTWWVLRWEGFMLQNVRRNGELDPTQFQEYRLKQFIKGKGRGERVLIMISPLSPNKKSKINSKKESNKWLIVLMTHGN